MTSMFGPAMLADLGWSKADYALIGSLPLATMFLVPFAGAFTDRFGPRIAAIVGFTAVPLGFVAMSFMGGSLIEFFLIYALQHVFGILTTTMVFARVVVERFDSARGIALSVMMSAPPLAGAIAAPLLGEVIDEHGWRAGYMAMAAICSIGGLISIPFISRGRPTAAASTRGQGPRPKVKDLLALFRNRTMLLILAGMFLVNIPQVFASSQLKLVVMDSGISSSMATWMVSLYALGVIVGRFLSGLALDRIEPHLVAIAALGLPAIGYVVLASSITAPGMIVFAVMIVGLAQGAEADIGAYLISRRFGIENFSLLLSSLTMMIGLGSAVGSLVLSVTLRINDSYVTFLLVSAVATLIGAAFFALTGAAKRREDAMARKEDEALLDQAIGGEIG
jgi:MFS family permease